MDCLLCPGCGKAPVVMESFDTDAGQYLAIVDCRSCCFCATWVSGVSAEYAKHRAFVAWNDQDNRSALLRQAALRELRD